MQSVLSMKTARHRFLFSARGMVGAFRVAVISLVTFALPVWSQQSATQPAATAVALASPGGDLADFIVIIARYTSRPKAATLKSMTICYAHGGARPTATIAADHALNLKGIPVVWQAIGAADGGLQHRVA